MNTYIMLLSTKRHVGLDLKAELDDALAEIQDLRANNHALRQSLEAQRVRYEQEIAYLKAVGRHLNDSIAEADTTTNNYRMFATEDRVRKFPESFKRIYRDLTDVQDVTGTTHAFGAFMQCVKSLVA